jgi:hypothetical protein
MSQDVHGKRQSTDAMIRANPSRTRKIPGSGRNEKNIPSELVLGRQKYDASAQRSRLHQLGICERFVVVFEREIDAVELDVCERR